MKLPIAQTLESPSMKMLIANWKMNTDFERARSLVLEILACEHEFASGVSVILCPPSVWLAEASRLCQSSRITTGGQDCHAERFGAFTGDVSAAMLRSAGAEWVLVGHSERRSYHRESPALLRSKIETACLEGLRPVLCVGETKTEREKGLTKKILRTQLEQSLPLNADFSGAIAYEPVWAIGGGVAALPAQIEEAHAAIRSVLEAHHGSGKSGTVPVLYGGAVKPENARYIAKISGVDGALVGGASLNAAHFLAIIRQFMLDSRSLE